MTYRIYYSPDNCIDSEGKGPTGDLARGVQVIMQPHSEIGVEIITSSDYYVLEDEHWRAVDIFGLFDYLLDSGYVLFGRTIRREEYAEVMKQVMIDKVGWLPGERRG